MAAVPFFRTGDNGNKGDQVRGFGFFHDGSVDTLFRFHGVNAFSFGATEAANIEQFMLASDTNLKPIVGQQVTLGSLNATAAGPRIALLIARDAAGDCELTVKDVLARRSGAARRQHRLLLGRAGQGERQPAVDGEQRSRRQVRRAAEHARAALLRRAMIAAVMLVRLDGVRAHRTAPPSTRSRACLRRFPAPSCSSRRPS
jgi:hypothetical protein